MEFPRYSIDKINNGILLLSHYFNGLFENCDPIIFVEELNQLFEFYSNDARFRTEKNKLYLIEISEQIICFEYTNPKLFNLEGNDNEPHDFQQFYHVYVDAYNVSMGIHEYFEKLFPNEFANWENDTPIIFEGAKYEIANEQPKTKTDKLKAPVLGLFCSLINKIGIDNKEETESAAIYCDRICGKFKLPYTDRVRQNYNVIETKKLIQELTEKVLPLIDNETKVSVKKYLDNKQPPKQNLYA